MRSWFLVLSVLGLFGCAASPVVPSAESGGKTRAPTADVSATLNVRSGPQGAWRPVRTGDTLRSGDEISLEVETMQPAYVYLARASGSGSFVSLFANEAGQQATPSAPLRFPPEEGALTLGQEPGTEDLRIVVALQALSATQFLEQAAAYSSERVRDPPPIATDNKRNPFAVRALFGASGIAVLRFSFLHR